jgi:hypothetical protein
VTKPWLTKALQGMPVPESLQACAVQDASAPDNDNNLLLFASSHHARSFHLIEN